MESGRSYVLLAVGFNESNVIKSAGYCEDILRIPGLKLRWNANENALWFWLIFEIRMRNQDYFYKSPPREAKHTFGSSASWMSWIRKIYEFQTLITVLTDSFSVNLLKTLGIS